MDIESLHEKNNEALLERWILESFRRQYEKSAFTLSTTKDLISVSVLIFQLIQDLLLRSNWWMKHQ